MGKARPARPFIAPNTWTAYINATNLHFFRENANAISTVVSNVGNGFFRHRFRPKHYRRGAQLALMALSTKRSLKCPQIASVVNKTASFINDV